MQIGGFISDITITQYYTENGSCKTVGDYRDKIKPVCIGGVKRDSSNLQLD